MTSRGCSGRNKQIILSSKGFYLVTELIRLSGAAAVSDASAGCHQAACPCLPATSPVLGYSIWPLVPLLLSPSLHLPSTSWPPRSVFSWAFPPLLPNPLCHCSVGFKLCPYQHSWFLFYVHPVKVSSVVSGPHKPPFSFLAVFFFFLKLCHFQCHFYSKLVLGLSVYFSKEVVWFFVCRFVWEFFRICIYFILLLTWETCLTVFVIKKAWCPSLVICTVLEDCLWCYFIYENALEILHSEWFDWEEYLKWIF